MLLNNVMPVNGSAPICIATRQQKILATEKTNNGNNDAFTIHFTDAIAFPGLINSHDHLDFNCFSPLGKRKYNNYTEWGSHIHANYKEEINTVLKIPEQLRTSWGMYKNLLAGVTTVVNHGAIAAIENPLITIFQETQDLHSVKFQKKWKWKLNNPFYKNKTCVLHTGEGVDTQSAEEIDDLIKWNLLNRKLVGVHGVAMKPGQAKKFDGLVWCPESNQVLLDRHADITRLKENTRIVFGTDSTLTGNWNIWKHLRLARALQLVDDAALFAMVTSAPAQLWGFNNGSLQPGKDADIIIAKTKNGQAGWENFFALNPEDILMVLEKGNIRMFDKIILPQLSRLDVDLSRFAPAGINKVVKYVAGDLPALVLAIRQYSPEIVFPIDR